MNVSNSSRFYIFDSEFAEKCCRKLNADIADTLRTHIHEKVRWAQDYRSAVDSVLNSPNLNDPKSPTPYIEFATSLVALMMVLCEVNKFRLLKLQLQFTLQGNRTVESVQ